MAKSYYVYIMSNKRYGVLYVGVTNDIGRRSHQHAEGMHKGFTKDYKLKQLFYAEHFADIKDAICLEKQLKHWNRQWKLDLIDHANPGWEPLNPAMFAV